MSVVYQYWQHMTGKVRQNSLTFLAEPAALLSSYQAHWLQIYAALGSFLFLVGVTLLLIQLGITNGDAHHLIRYLYLLIIIIAAYVLDQRIAIWLAIFCTGIYLPSMVQAMARQGFTPSTIELCALLFSYNAFAVFTSTMTAFGRDHWRLSLMIERFEAVFKQAFDLSKVPLWILENSVQLTNATAAEIYLVQPDELNDNLGYAEILTDDDLSSLAHWALERNQIVNLSHFYQDPRLKIVQSYRSENGNLLIVPLGSPAHKKGILVLWRQTHRFRQREEELIQLLVARGYLIIENARLHAQTGDALAQRAAELAILLDVSNTFAASLELNHLLENLSRKLLQVTGAEACQIYLFDPKSAELTRQPTHSLQSHNATKAIFRAEDLPFHFRVMKDGISTVCEAAQSSVEMSRLEEETIFQPDQAVALFLPLIFRDRPFGVTVLSQQAAQGGFSPDKIKLSEAIAREAVLALSNARAYQSLQEAHQHIKLLIDNVAEGVFSVDTERRITDFNPAAEDLTGYAAEDARKLPVDQIILCEEKRCPLCRHDLSLQEAALSGDFDWPSHCKAKIRCQNGDERAVSLSVSPLMTADDQVSGAVSVVHDISKEEELVRMKSEFISLVSHQLRTPLTNISIAAEMLNDVETPQPADLKLLQTLKLQSTRLRRLVDQVLMASRLERGQYQKKPVLEPLALRPMLEETLTIFRAQHPELYFQLALAAEPIFALGDRVLVEVILENLIQNAIDHAGKIQRIEVSVVTQDDSVLISVADDGDGISKSEQDRIFDPFRSGYDVDKKRRGFGLGLYLTRMAVESQGGQIWLESNTERGTRFCFTLRSFSGD